MIKAIRELWNELKHPRTILEIVVLGLCGVTLLHLFAIVKMMQELQ